MDMAALATMRLFLLLTLVAVFVGGLGTQALSLETFARLLQRSDATTPDKDAHKPPKSAAPMSAPTPVSNAPVSSNATSSSQASASNSDSTQSTGTSEGGGNDSSGGGKHGGKNDYGSYPAPIAAPTTAPKKNPGGSFVAPVASPSAADLPLHVYHAAAATDDDNVNATSSGGSATPGNSEPLAHHVYKTTSTNTTIILPEGQQPKHWPQFIFILFVLATIVLCGIAARKSCSKRRNYEEVPTTLLV